MHSKVRLTQLHFLLSRGELGGICPGVVDSRVSQMVVQVGNGALSGDNGLDKEPEHGEHGESSVLDLLDLELGEGVGVLSQVQGVELATGVQGILNLTQGTAVHSVSLNGTHKDNLRPKDGKDALGVDEAGVAKVVKASRGEDLRASLEPDRLTELNTVSCKELGGDTPKGSKHSPPSVDQLQLAVLGEGLGVCGQTSRVPAVVTSELTGQVAGGLTGEWSQPLEAVRAVPGAGGSRLDSPPHLDLGLGGIAGQGIVKECTWDQLGSAESQGGSHVYCCRGRCASS